MNFLSFVCPLHTHGTRYFAACGVAAAAGFTAPLANAQVHGPGPSDPGLFARSLNVNARSDFDSIVSASPFSVSGNTQLNVRGSVGGTPTLGDGFEVFAQIEFPNPAAFGSEVNLFAGIVGDGGSVNGSEFNVLGGAVGNMFTANAGAFVTISGGSVGGFFTANSLSTVQLTGGTVGFGFNNFGTSAVEFVGGEFWLNDVAFSGPTISIGVDDIFTGTLADGSSFIFSGRAFDGLSNVTLTSAALPAINATPRTVTTNISGGPARRSRFRDPAACWATTSRWSTPS